MKKRLVKWGIFFFTMGLLIGLLITQRIYGDFETDSYQISPSPSISIDIPSCTPTPAVASPSATMTPPTPTIDTQIGSAASDNNAGSSASMPLLPPDTGR